MLANHQNMSAIVANARHLEDEVAILRTALVSAERRAQEAQQQARRRVMEHAIYHPQTRTYTISELALDAWGLR